MSREGGERRDDERLNCQREREREMERVAAACWSSTHGAVPRGAPGKQASMAEEFGMAYISKHLDQSITHS